MRLWVLGGMPREPTPVHRQTAWSASVFTDEGVKRACENPESISSGARDRAGTRPCKATHEPQSRRPDTGHAPRYSDSAARSLTRRQPRSAAPSSRRSRIVASRLIPGDIGHSASRLAPRRPWRRSLPRDAGDGAVRFVQRRSRSGRVTLVPIAGSACDLRRPSERSP